MLKKLKRQLPASRINKQSKTTSIRKERSITKNKVYDPVAISKHLDCRQDHFIIYPAPSGYRYTLFSRIEDNDPFDILAVIHKPYKLKSEAIRVMKRMLRSLGMSSFTTDYLFAYDHKGNKISLKIEYDIKMLL